MTKKLFIIIMAAVSLMWGCCPCRNLTTETTRQDSTRVEVRTKTILVPDTVFVEIPAQTAERTTRDSVSHLENDYATSDARINPDGSLFHDLNTKAQKKPVTFQKPVERRDSIVYRLKTVTAIEYVKVPRELTWFQETQIYGFWAAIVFLMITYTIKICKTHIHKIREK